MSRVVRHSRRVIAPSAAIIGLALMSAAPVAAAPITFTDTQFNLADYTVSQATNLTYGITVAQTLTGGNPGAALQITFSGTSTLPGFLAVTLLNSNFVYDPAVSGEIPNITASLDRYGSVSGQLSLPTTTGRVLISQSGLLYTAIIEQVPFAEAQWVSLSGALTASNFARYTLATDTIDATQLPDFSAAGAPITFGYVQRFTINGSGTYAIPIPIDLRADNYRVRINAVPEPATLGLMLLGGVAAWRKRRPR